MQEKVLLLQHSVPLQMSSTVCFAFVHSVDSFFIQQKQQENSLFSDLNAHNYYFSFKCPELNLPRCRYFL